jgi:CheY-like chemotaxis protein
MTPLKIGGGQSMTKKEPKRNLQVLHLEDDLHDAELIKAELEEHQIPCTVTLISNADEFGSALRQRDIDLVLSDSSVPGFDTLSALRFAHRHRPEVPFIFVSGNPSLRFKAEAFRLGACDFINKRDVSKLPRVITWLFFGNDEIINRGPLPSVGIPVIVQCEEFRCLGFFGADGKWRDFCSSAELPSVNSWSEL